MNRSWLLTQALKETARRVQRAWHCEDSLTRVSVRVLVIKITFPNAGCNIEFF
jgi:hypothetical protein